MKSAAERLAEALADAAHRGDRWPCKDRPEWVSDDLDERAVAARACRDCSALSLCHAAADELGEKHHVWGGRDRTARKTQRTRTPSSPQERK